MAYVRQKHGRRDVVRCVGMPVENDDIELVYVIPSRDFNRLLTAINGVTVFHRHGKPILKRRLDRLANMQLDIEKLIEEQENER